MTQIKKKVKTALRRAYAAKKLGGTATIRSVAKQLGWSHTKVARMLNPKNDTPLDVEDTLALAETLDCVITDEMIRLLEECAR